MAFIQAPSYKPPQLNDTWGGLADIFGDIVSMRESKRQRERQRIADAQRAAAAASLERNRKQLYDERAAKMAEYEAGLAREKAERDRINALRLSPEQFAREATIANARQPIPTLPSDFSPYPGEQGRKPSPTMFGYKGPTEYDRNVARANMMRGVTSDEALTWKRLEDAASTIAKREQDATKAFHQGQIDEVTFNKLSVQLSREKQALEQALNEAQYEINKKRDDAKSANINVGYYQDRRDKGALDLEQNQTTASALNRQRRLEDVASGVHKFPLETLATEESDAGPNYRKPTSVEQDYARQELIRKGYADQYKPLQREALGLADAAIGKRNWDTSLDKSGYTRAKMDTLADTFAPQFETQFNDSDEVSKREAEQMSRYALAAAKQIFNNPNIPLPRGTTALDLYNQILNQRELYSIDNGFRAFGIGNTNYEPITEVATIIENWQKLNSAERPQGNQEQATNNVTFTGINKQTGEQVTVTQEELIAAARERYPHMSIEVAIAKVKQDLGIQ